jgi:hypothetical protein
MAGLDFQMLANRRNGRCKWAFRYKDCEVASQ